MSTITRRIVLTGVLAVPTALLGCRSLGSVLYFLQPRQWVQPVVVFEGERVALFVDAPSQYSNPVFEHALHETMEKEFRRAKVDAVLVPYQETRLLRQKRPDLSKLSIQAIGRELAADIVIYAYVQDFGLRASRESPIVQAHTGLRIKVVDVNRPVQDAVRYPAPPNDEEGEVFHYHRQAKEAATRELEDRESRKLGTDVGRRLARYFYKYDEEDKLRPEP